MRTNSRMTTVAFLLAFPLLVVAQPKAFVGRWQLDEKKSEVAIRDRIVQPGTAVQIAESATEISISNIDPAGAITRTRVFRIDGSELSTVEGDRRTLTKLLRRTDEQLVVTASPRSNQKLTYSLVGQDLRVDFFFSERVRGTAYYRRIQ